MSDYTTDDDGDQEGSLRILVVNEKEKDYRIICRLLKKVPGTHFRVEWSPSFEEAEAQINQNQHDIYLVDDGLPTGKGLQLVRQAVQKGQTRPIILISSKDDRQIDLEATKAGAADYLSKKQMDSQLLERSIRYATKQHQALKALKASEDRFRRLLETANVIPWEMDLELQAFTYVGPQVVDLLGYPLASWTQPEFWKTHIHPEDLEAICLLGEGTKQGEEQETEFRICDIKGRIVWLRAFVSVAPSPSSSYMLQGFFFDITDQKNAEEALRLSEEQLRQSQKMDAMGRLAGGIAHDFNNLLTAITGYTDLWLQKASKDSLDTSYAQEVKKAAQRAADLTRQLLSFSRRELTQTKPVRFNHVVTEATSILHRVVGENFQIITQLERPLGWIQADPVQLEQVLLNLVVNARDAMPRGGSITIKTSNFTLPERSTFLSQELLPGDYVLLMVRDEGCGIPDKVKENIFEPFFTTKGPGQGTGLGLSTVYGIVKQSQGYIHVESQEDKGTTFTLFFPRVAQPSTPQPSLPSPLSTTQTKGTILIIEDEDLVRNLVCKILNEEGYTVLEAPNGYKALEMARKQKTPIDLMLTDLIMPYLNGKETAEQLLRYHPETQVILMSGYLEERPSNPLIAGSPLHFLRKPFTPQSLIQKVGEILQKTREPRALNLDVSFPDSN